MEPKNLPRGSKTIRLPFNKGMYEVMMNDGKEFRSHVDGLIERHPEVFPHAITEGYELHGKTLPSAKLGIQQRRIRILATNEVYSICPSFVMPYVTGLVSDVEMALFYQRFSMPYWALTYGFGRNDMYWYRMVTAFGRCSIVGTTVKNPECLPKDLVADEKHTSLKGEKVYGATTVGGGCLLGASVSQSASEEALTEAYGKFADEAKNVDPEYQVETVNTDGWKATGNSWKTLFPFCTIIYCFLHAFINIRNRCKKKYKNLYNDIAEAVWDVFKAFDHPNAHRTSNMVDRLMRWLDRYLFNMQYFHGNLASAEAGIRAWAILRNFQPYCAGTVGSRTELVCTATELNGFKYSDNLLENLLIASSMGGYRQ